MSPVVAQFLRTLSDNSSHELRQNLKPYVLRAIGTERDGRDPERLDACRAWLIRLALPEALHLAGHRDMAARLRDQPDPLTEEDASRLLSEARRTAWTARRHAYNSVPGRPAVALAAAAATAQAAREAAAGAGAVAAAIYADAGAHLSGFPADAGSYADAPAVAASATTGTYSDAAVARAYADPATTRQTSPQSRQDTRERLLDTARVRFTPLAERLHGEALSLLDQMLSPELIV